MSYFHHQNSQTIWVQSPCTLPYVSKQLPIQKAKRFQYNSIYYKDDPFKPARKIDQFQKPELLLSEFRRQVREASRKPKNLKETSGHQVSRNSSNGSLSKYNSKTIEIVERLYPKEQKKLKVAYDCNGNRSSFCEDRQTIEDLNISKMSKSSSKSRQHQLSFTESSRLDLARPHNFNPGPGSYFTKTWKGKPFIYKNKKSLELR